MSRQIAKIIGHIRYCNEKPSRLFVQGQSRDCLCRGNPEIGMYESPGVLLSFFGGEVSCICEEVVGLISKPSLVVTSHGDIPFFTVDNAFVYLSKADLELTA